MKDLIFEEILKIEEQYKGPYSPWCIQYNSKEYYAPFTALYLKDSTEFSQSVQVLLSLNDISSEHTKQLSYFVKERVDVHLWRLSVYFQLNVERLPAELHQILLHALDLKRSPNIVQAEAGRRLYHSAIEFLKSLHEKRASPEAQLYYSDVPYSLPDFKDMIRLDQVFDVFTAIYYFDCYRCKLVKKPPQSLERALKAAAVYDHLYSSVLWCDYLFYTTDGKKDREIQLLRSVGLEKVPALLEKIEKELRGALNRSEFFYNGKKLEFCRRICLKYKSQIEECMNAEKNTINEYIQNQLNP